ncbi:MAG: helix-turn-helix domain-containing protein [Acidimicrobiales bacterium]
MGLWRAPRPAGSYDLAADVPSERLAHLLRRARVRSGLDERAMARAVGARTKDLKAWEDGEVRPDDDALARYAQACGTTPDDLLRRRDTVEIDPHAGTMRVGSSVARFDWRSTSNTMVLHTYLGLVREQRSMRPGQPVVFRDDDAESLSIALDLADPSLPERLVQIVGLTPAEADRIRDRMLRHRMRIAHAAAAARSGPNGPGDRR